MSLAIRSAARQAGTVLVALGLLGSLLVSPVQARHQDQAELSQVLGELDAIAKVLADARTDADQVARALVRADRDVAVARVALANAERRYRQAQARRAQGVREAALARLEVDAQQALIDRRARETYLNRGPSMMLTLLADADTIADLLDRGKLLDEVAKAANAELAALVAARVEAEEASRRAAAAEQAARAARAVMRARATELEQLRAARAAAKRALERKIADLQVRQSSLRRKATRILGAITAEEAARRRATQAAATRARQATVGGQGPIVPHEDEHGAPGPSTASYQRLTPTAKRLYGLVTRSFDIHSIGGWRPTGSVPGSDHPRGRALDVFISYPSAQGQALGWRVANWAADNAWALEVKYLIFNGRIWTGDQGWHGYRHPSDPCNCNPTLRHDDHVHISVRR
jgi:hypothetical protein